MYKSIKYRVRGKMLDIIKSMYENVRSSVKYNNTLSDDFSWVFQGSDKGNHSPFLFSMYFNKIEEHFFLNGFEGKIMICSNCFLLLYADDIVIVPETEA